MSLAAAENDRRTSNVLQLGVIQSVNAEAAKAVVKIGDLVTPPIPVAQMRAGSLSFWWMPAEGEQVLVGAPSGDMAQAIVIISVFAGNAPSSDAAVPMIDLNGGKMIVKGDIEVTGDVIASGVSLVNHTHGGVVPGMMSTGEPEK